MKAITAVLALLLAFTVLAYVCQRGAFYETGAQYYDSCWQKAQPGSNAESSGQAALWAQCEPLADDAFFQAGYELGGDLNPTHADFDPNPTPQVRNVNIYCPNAFTDVPDDDAPANDAIFGLVVKLVQNSGGPTLIDQFEPARKLILRALKSRWPGCLAAVSAVARASP